MGLVPLTTPAHVSKRRTTALVFPPVTTIPASPRSPVVRLRAKPDVGVSEEPVSPLSGSGPLFSSSSIEMADTFVETPQPAQAPDPCEQEWMNWYRLWMGEHKPVYAEQTDEQAVLVQHDSALQIGTESHAADQEHESGENVAMEACDTPTTEETAVVVVREHNKNRWGLFGMLAGGVAAALMAAAH